jgi:transposase
VRSKCTQAKRRSLSVRRQEAHFALDAARKREQTEEFKKEYAKRAGVEGVHAEASASDGLAAFALHWRASHPTSRMS